MAQLSSTAQSPPAASEHVLAVDAHARCLASFARIWEEGEEEASLSTDERAAAAANAAAARAPIAPPTAPPTAPLEHVATEHFWLSGLYWGLTALGLLGRLDSLDTDKAWQWVQRCFRPACERDGAVAAGGGGGCGGGSGGGRGRGYGGSPRHDPHLLPTTSAVQVAALLGRLDEVDADAVEECACLLLV